MNLSEGSGRDKWGVRLMTASDFIRREPQDLEVPEGEEMTLWADDEQFAERFARIQVNSHKDLQLLGLLPRRLEVDKLLSVIRMDDESAQRIAQEQSDRGGRAKPCGCGCDDEGADDEPYGRNLRRMTQNVRKGHHPMLANLLSDHYSARVHLDSSLAAVTWKWATSIEQQGSVSVIATLFRDITINRGATLRVDKASKLLMAGNIRIHRTGQLVYQGGYLKIWAHSIVAFNDFSEVANIDHIFPWLQN